MEHAVCTDSRIIIRLLIRYGKLVKHIARPARAKLARYIATLKSACSSCVWYRGELALTARVFLLPGTSRIAECFGTVVKNIWVCALNNRQELELTGKEIVAEMVEKMLGNPRYPARRTPAQRLLRRSLHAINERQSTCSLFWL